jgi:branched-subunit amino acid aminotransferase/4-amino-4-deoxychorismate lyase
VSTATEVFAMSTVKEVTPVISVGDREFPIGPVTVSLRELFRAFVTGAIRAT